MIQNICFESDLKELTPSDIEFCYGPFGNVDEVDSFGDTLLLAACKNKQIDYVRHYLSLDADPNYVNGCGDSPIHIAGQSWQEIVGENPLIRTRPYSAWISLENLETAEP